MFETQMLSFHDEKHLDKFVDFMGGGSMTKKEMYFVILVLLAIIVIIITR